MEQLAIRSCFPYQQCPSIPFRTRRFLLLYQSIWTLLFPFEVEDYDCKPQTALVKMVKQDLSFSVHPNLSAIDRRCKTGVNSRTQCRHHHCIARKD